MADPSASVKGSTNPDKDEQDLALNPSLVTRRIRDLLRSEKAISFSDVTLISSEGTKIPAIRALLVIRSTYFEKMLTSDFAEKNSGTVEVSLPANLLHLLLDFIYTDDCLLVREICSPTTQRNKITCESALKTVELAFAADYTGIDRLLRLCKKALKLTIEKQQHSLCVVLEQLTKSNAIWGTDLMVDAFCHVTGNPRGTLLRGCDECKTHAGVRSLSAQPVETLLKRITGRAATEHRMFESSDDYTSSLDVGTQVFFQILTVWASATDILVPRWSKLLESEPYVFTDFSKAEWDPELLPEAKRLAKLFDLAQFSPTVLIEVVEKSGLLSDRDTNAAYRRLAIMFERNIKKRRRY